MKEVMENSPGSDRRKFLKAALGLAALSIIPGDKTKNQKLPSTLQPEQSAVNKAELRKKILGILNSKKELDFNSFSEIVSELKALSPNIISELQELTKDKDEKVRYSAYDGLALICYYADKKSRQEIIPLLKPGLAEEAIGLRSLIAGNLVSFGEKEGIAVLIESLDEKYAKIGMQGEPPTNVPGYAITLLKRFTGQNYSKNQAQWQTWWQESQKNLVWEENLMQFIIKKNEDY